jgi:DNA helicase-2/ATP-dependent DNA helicase PcrA
MERGVHPSRIGFLSFTRKATEEARDRAMARFNLASEDLPWFRTLHSIVFRCLGLSRGEVVTSKHNKQVADLMGVRLSFGIQRDDGEVSTGSEIGDRLFFYYDVARNKTLDPMEYFRKLQDPDISESRFKLFVDTYEMFKKRNDLVDYTDMMQRFLDGQGVMSVPRLERLFLDEAQDFTRLQWRVVGMMVRNCERSHLAGDDDQSIYGWAGADIATFLKLRERGYKVLEKSYRLPRSVFKVADKISSRISQRFDKTWHPRDCEGSVSRIPSIRNIDMGRGKWLVLARNYYLLEQAEQVCRTLGWSYESKSWSPRKSEVVRAIRYWDRLKEGGRLETDEVKAMYTMMEVGKGVKRGFKTMPSASSREEWGLKDLVARGGLLANPAAPWEDALSKIDSKDRNYIKKVVQGEGSMSEEPRIILSTIHGAKGGECESVVLIPDMSFATYRGFQGNPDGEHRVYYVGATRAKENLILVDNQTSRSYRVED